MPNGVVANERQPQPHIILPEITLSGYEESGQNDIPSVLHQQSYTGDKPVIKSSLADTLCSKLSVNELLEMLNGILGTSYTLEILSKSLQSALRSCIERHYDFGTAYARLRPYWFEYASRDIVEDERNDQDMRIKLLANSKIIDGDTPPRRVWDLYANRVVPYWVVRKDMSAISHAWVNDEELKHVRTPINQNEWSVPIPEDANLDLIRIEMLNLGAEYVWLDVLCLRQKLGKKEKEEHRKKGTKEKLRLEEWKVDVPTIGWVYHEADQVVCYFNGLGRPLGLTLDYFESDRCWFKRAWTLQEMNTAPIIGGRAQTLIAEENILNSFHTLARIQTRKSTKPVDRVAALVYLFYSEYIPIYKAKQRLEGAWTTLCNVTQDWFRTDLFFLYPKPGDGKKFWRPSWNQLMAETERETLRRVLDHHTNRYMGEVKQGPDNFDWYIGPYIESGEVRRLSHGAPKPDESALKKLLKLGRRTSDLKYREQEMDVSAQKKPRRGELCLKDSFGETHTFKIISRPQILNT
ncbi:hypothetical protein EV421DRAFT_1926398 [Armillaria borealis]|uniref:Heterokaryon incompatibility domain-containing protein n=1 Tax=Armillaria borealis TaxID=47425 RepID=A0AA39JUC1_9AGAR|nr:hypothetical protein EV421DRAFT_1926398 [Armillaria borealis]